MRPAFWKMRMSFGDANGAAGSERTLVSSNDTLLNGCVHIRQSTTGYRAAIDPVLLAAAVPTTRPGQRVLDLGCGPGAALLCYLFRVVSDHALGVEIDPDAADLARANIEANGFSDRATIVEGDARNLSDLIDPASFDQVFANPPYLDPKRADRPPNPDKDRSHVEGPMGLAQWLDAMLAALRPKGGLTLIHRADRVQEILVALGGRVGDVEILPLWPRVGVPAKRVIVRGRKGVRGGTNVHPGLILHGEGQAYTEAAQAILRDGGALP